MMYKNLLLVLAAACIAVSSAAYSAPSRRSAYDPAGEAAVREIKDNIDLLRHEANNHEEEIRAFEERLNNDDAILESLRKQMTDLSKTLKEQLKAASSSLEAKIGHLENSYKALVSDLKLIKNHANETTHVLGQHKQKIQDLEKIVEAQNQNIENLQNALRAMMDAMQAKDGEPVAAAGQSNKIYHVKAGDSLEKIARAHQTTIETIKMLNTLPNDRIIIGQKLKLPDN